MENTGYWSLGATLIIVGIIIGIGVGSIVVYYLSKGKERKAKGTLLSLMKNFALIGTFIYAFFGLIKGW